MTGSTRKLEREDRQAAAPQPRGAYWNYGGITGAT
jgi:hypothetical protein